MKSKASGSRPSGSAKRTGANTRESPGCRAVPRVPASSWVRRRRPEVREGFVINEVDGRWSSTARFPGLAITGQTGSILNTVSCGSKGDCSAGGSYTDNDGNTTPFLVDETAGNWSRPLVVKGPPSDALVKYALIQSISCGASSGCTAFGESLGTRSKGLYFFVLTKRDGAWSRVRLLPGTLASTFRGFSGSEMACSVSGSCTIAGSYFTLFQSTRPYGLSEDNDRFSRMENLRGVHQLNLAPTAGSVITLSCGAIDNCVIVEFFASMDYDNSFLVQESSR